MRRHAEEEPYEDEDPIAEVNMKACFDYFGANMKSDKIGGMSHIIKKS